jgi:NAD(P)-dependent dehydrogenase (short-subunit alcohol dehydrogenase family)
MRATDPDATILAMGWSIEQMADQRGRNVIVTGGNSGIGRAGAEALAARGAAVTLAVRDVAKGRVAAQEITARHPDAQVEVFVLDLADLASVRRFAGDWAASHPDGLDVLVNNAGVMAIPRRETADGFEMQLGTNHLGHFALTGLLSGALNPAARVVTVSSEAHRFGAVDFDDLQSASAYRRWRAYGQSKLANLLFAIELHRRISGAGADLGSIAVHPGYAATNLQLVAPRMSGSRLAVSAASLANRLLAQPAEAGAWSMLMAATDPDVPSGTYVGPMRRWHQRGEPGLQVPSDAARDPLAAARLWEVSRELTGVRLPW